MTAACNIPPEIQPAIPPDGLFGPDGFMPGWGFPGYHHAPDITHPHILPATRPIEGPYGAGGGNLPGTRPNPSMPGFGLTVTSYGEILGGIFAKYGPPVRTITVKSRFINSGTGLSTGTSDESAGSDEESAEKKTSTTPDHAIATRSGESTTADSVEVVHQRTGIVSHKEKTQDTHFKSPQAAVTYYTAQAKGYHREAKLWAGGAAVGAALTIAAGALGVFAGVAAGIAGLGSLALTGARTLGARFLASRFGQATVSYIASQYNRITNFLNNVIANEWGGRIPRFINGFRMEDHAITRMIGRKIPVELVEEALAKGTQYENPEYPGQIQYFLQNASASRGALHVSTRGNVIIQVNWLKGNKPPWGWF